MYKIAWIVTTYSAELSRSRDEEQIVFELIQVGASSAILTIEHLRNRLCIVELHSVHV